MRVAVVFVLAVSGLLSGCPRPPGSGGGSSGGGGGGGGSASASVSVSASVSFPDPPANTAVVVDATADPAHAALAACAKGDVNAQLQIVSDFKDSCHEMIICGGLTASFSGSLFMILVNAALRRSGGEPALVYQGNGVYQAGDVMTLTMHLGADTSFGKTGDIIPFDVMDLGTYFKSARIQASASFSLGGRGETSYSMAFDQVGPGVELLGVARDAQPPVKLDFQAMANALGSRVQAAQNISVKDEKGGSHIEYRLTGPPAPIGNLFGHAPQQMRLASVDARRAETSQTITVTEWAMQYQPGSSGTLDGSITFEVRGGAFPYRVKFVYPHRKEPDVSLSCL